MPASSPPRRQSRPASRRSVRPVGLATLRGFEAAARRLSFTAAAEELHLTQSSVSRQIAELERQIGKPLFVRRARALRLTPGGESLYAAVRRALAEIDRAVSAVRGEPDVPRVTVATYASFSSLWLVPRLADFRARHPGIDIRIDASDHYADLDAEEIDVAIRTGMPDRMPQGAVLLEEEFVGAALSPALLDTLAPPLVHPEDLDRLTLLAPDRSMIAADRYDWHYWCRSAGVAPFAGRGRLFFNYVDQAVQAAIRGQGAAIVRTPFLGDAVAAGTLVEPFPHLRARTGANCYLIVNAATAGLPHVQAFRDWVAAQFRTPRASMPGG